MMGQSWASSAHDGWGPVVGEAACPDRYECHSGSPCQRRSDPHRPTQHGQAGGDVGQAGDGQDGLRQRGACRCARSPCDRNSPEQT